jgi:uracil-DNA glycosylase family 4
MPNPERRSDNQVSPFSGGPQGRARPNRAAVATSDWDRLHADVLRCEKCPRLRAYCQRVAIEKKRAYADWDYFAKPIPGFGDPAAWLWIIGLAPAAHGGNRTGRVFTGDRSGDFLYAALHRAGLANQPTSRSIDDGLQLIGCYVSAAVRCAPPANKPLPAEIANCAAYLDREWDLLPGVRTILALGKIAWDAALSLARRKGVVVPSPKPVFGHGAATPLTSTRRLIGSYHVSQQNTFTGRLTPDMFDAVLAQCRPPAAD